jgi:hypothetical protein
MAGGAAAVQPASVDVQVMKVNDQDAVRITWTPGATVPDNQRYEVIAKPTLAVWAPDPLGGDNTNPNQCTIVGLERGIEYTFEVRGYIGADRSRATQGQEHGTTSDKTAKLPPATPSGTWKATSFGACGVALIAALVLVIVWLAKGDGERWGSLTLATAVIFVGFLLLTLCGGTFGLWSPIVGHDRRVSTSRVQFALWTVLIAFILVYLSYKQIFYGHAAFDASEKGVSATDEVWSDYLILLGGPFAALVFARGIVGTKVDNQTLQKSLDDDGTTNIKQALTKDDDSADLVDSQYLLFNLVAFTYVILAFAHDGKLPAIPSILLALTSPAAAVYVLNKAIASNAPALNSITPLRAERGEKIVLGGVNFMPAGTTRVPTVTIAGKLAFVDSDATDSRLSVAIPMDAPTGFGDVVVTTGARISTQARSIQVDEADTPASAAPPPEPPALPVLGQGSTGDAVGVLQQRLNAHGAQLAVDGIFGPLTYQEVRRFQANAGLVVDGLVGPQTWGALATT